MKKLLLLFFLTFSATLLFGQDIPEKANTIVVTFADSSNLQEKISKVFTEKDYKVKTTSKTAKKIVTGPKTLKGDTRVALAADIKGAEVFLTGSIVVAAQSGMKVEYKGKKGTPIMNAWEEMDKVAKALGGKITYEVK